MTHTPGPWTVMQPASTSGWGLCVGSETRITARIPSGPEREANALLIAAAPDLLNALIRMCRWAEADKVNYTGDHPVAQARAAIERAGG